MTGNGRGVTALPSVVLRGHARTDAAHEMSSHAMRCCQFMACCRLMP